MDLLARLVECPAVAGREHRIRRLLQTECASLFDKVTADPLGSLICSLKKQTRRSSESGDPPLKILVAAHMDQVGFMVREVCDNGVLRVTPIGSLDRRSLSYRIVRICPSLETTKDDLFGTMVPPSPSFLMEKGTNARSDFEPDEFLVDLGSTREGERHRVRIGDMVVFDSPLRVHGDELVGASLDNRVACWIILRAIQILANTPHEIYCVFTAQEEVGIRGAGPAAFQIQPDVAIVIDMMLAPDHPGASSHSTAPKLGHGPVLSVMDGGSISDIQILSAIESIAKLNGISHQRSIMMCGGTDSAAIQRSGGGVRTVSIACATRYLHTPTEMVSRRDIEACRDLLAAIISSPISDAWKSGSGGPS